MWCDRILVIEVSGEERTVRDRVIIPVSKTEFKIALKAVNDKVIYNSINCTKTQTLLHFV